MSWFARSIANSLKLDDEDGNDVSNPNQNQAEKNSPSHAEEQDDDPSSPTSPSRGVKEDISELTKTFSRQFWGVASFLAPPPQAEPYKPPHDSDLTEYSENSELNSDSEEAEQVGVGGIRSDFAEIGGKFRSGISKLSTNIAVSEFTKIASNFLQLGSDDEGEEAKSGIEGRGLGRGAIGVTEEVVFFARDISMHPGTWLDFPLPGNEDEDDDDDSFELSDVQQEHALAVEHLVPLLATLRMELCPGYMSESLFWRIYFVLLHPQLNEHDAALLSTPQVLETRALLSHKLPSRTSAKPEEWSETGAGDAKDTSSQNVQPQYGSMDASITAEKSEDEAFSSQNAQPQYGSMDASVAADKSEGSSSQNAQAQHGSMDASVTAEKSEGSSSSTDGPETEKHAVESTAIQMVDKSMIEEKHVDHQIKDEGVHSGSSNVSVDKVEDDYDDWLKEESSEAGGASTSMVTVEDEEDVSFSDLEEDDDGEAPSSVNKAGNSSNTQDWVQLSKAPSDSSKKVTSNDPETKESTDWLDVDIDDS